MRKSTITSAKPISPERSMTTSETGLPRTFSTIAQKMWPPSSGRNGSRLMTPSERLITARTRNAWRVSVSKLCFVISVLPTTPLICSRWSFSKM